MLSCHSHCRIEVSLAYLTCHSPGLTGREEFTLRGITTDLAPRQLLEVEARGAEGVKRFSVLVRVDNTTEATYLRHGGVLQMALRQMLKTDRTSEETQ